MKTALTKSAKRVLTFAAIAVPTMALQGCYEDDYLSRRDTISLGAGDAIATSKVTHTVDPWPPHSSDTDIEIDGKRAEIAAERYKHNKVIPPRGLRGSGQSSGGGGAAPKVTN